MKREFTKMTHVTPWCWGGECVPVINGIFLAPCKPGEGEQFDWEKKNKLGARFD